MPNRIRFHLDENVNLAVADALRFRGYDVTIPKDQRLIGAVDEDHLAFATRQGRVLVTHDADFLRMHEQNYIHCGIAFTRRPDQPVGDLIRSLALIGEVLSAEEMEQHIEYL